MELNLQYIINEKGQKSAVQLPIKNWEIIKDKLKELELLKNKKDFLFELNEAVEEMKSIKEGKIKARDAEEFLNDL